MIGLKKVRRAKKLKQFQVAMDLNLSREAICLYETGKRQPSFDILIQLSKYFNVSIHYLITGEEFKK